MSAAFTDRTGQRWHVPLDVVLVERVRDELDVDLLSPGIVPQLLKADPVLTFRVLSVLLADRIEPRDLSRRLKGDAITEAALAIVEAITDFFLRRRTSRPATTASRKPTRAHRRPWNAVTGSPVRSELIRCSPASRLAS